MKATVFSVRLPAHGDAAAVLHIPLPWFLLRALSFQSRIRSFVFRSHCLLPLLHVFLIIVHNGLVIAQIRAAKLAVPIVEIHGYQFAVAVSLQIVGGNDRPVREDLFPFMTGTRIAELILVIFVFTVCGNVQNAVMRRSRSHIDHM